MNIREIVDAVEKVADLEKRVTALENWRLAVDSDDLSELIDQPASGDIDD